MKINDSHVHVGQFNENYFSPESVYTFLKSVGIEYFAVSSSSICGNDIEKTLEDINYIILLSKHKALPVLWLTPEIFRYDCLDFFLKSKIMWKCVKMHGFHDWTHKEIEKAVSVAQQLNIPFMMHTGGREWCNAGQYYSLCKNYPHQLFILAHSRPCDETIHIMKNCENTWADTAFTPLNDIVKMVNEGLEDRIIWGSDYPITKLYYKRCSIKKIYLKKIEELSSIIKRDSFMKIIELNFKKIFRLLCI